jgi:3-oxoisoapionate decarboxylase
MAAMGIGIESFSYHRYFGEFTPWEKPLDIRWQMSDFIARTAQLGADAVSLQTVYLPGLDSEQVTALREQLNLLGLQRVLAWGHGTGLNYGNDPHRVEALRSLFPLAQALGCPIVRLVNGNHFSWKDRDAEQIKRLKPLLQDLAHEAAVFNLTLAIENHADFTMRELVTLVENVAASNFGICFDTGNTVRVGDDLLEAAELAAPWIKMVHLKDMVVQEESGHDPTLWWPSAPLGRGQFDLPAFVGLLRAKDFNGYLFIEMANMYTDWRDEDAAVAESIAYLRQLLKCG